MTDLEIFNCALVRVGCEPLASLVGTTKAHRLYTNIYAGEVKKLIYSHPWNFALKRVTLTENGNTPNHEFGFEFDTPADFLRILDIENYQNYIYKIEDGKILANDETLNIRYIYSVTDPALFTVGFAEALELKLAEKMAYNFTQSNTFRKDLQAAFESKLDDVRAFDAQGSGTPIDFQQEVFLDSRK